MIYYVIYHIYIYIHMYILPIPSIFITSISHSPPPHGRCEVLLDSPELALWLQILAKDSRSWATQASLAPWRRCWWKLETYVEAKLVIYTLYIYILYRYTVYILYIYIFAYSALGQVWCMLLIQLCQTCIYANCYILVQSISQNG